MQQPMLHESLVGVERGLARLYCASRFVRACCCSSGGFFYSALTKAGGGVFSFSNSSMRAWATRNCSVTSSSRSKACLSWASNDAIVSSAVMPSVYQKRVNLNSIAKSELYLAFSLRLPTEVCGTHQSLLRNSSTKLPSIARLINNRNYSGTFLAPPAAALEKKGFSGDTPRPGQGTASPGTPCSIVTKTH
jgi:hypothetical protein